MRVNPVQGGANIIDLPPLERWLTPENAADVAAVRLTPPAPRYDLAPVTNSMFAGNEVIAEERMGIGDELVVTGLFRSHYGVQRNEPIVRSGIIAAMPADPLTDPDTGEPYSAYLAELRSLGGLSGSPVFVRLDPQRAYNRVATRKYYLLGLVRGHWDARRGADVEFGPEAGEVNAGIAIVTPIAELTNLLYQDDEVKYRRRTEREWLTENAPILDGEL